MPGTGRVVTYIVIQRYRYSVPTMQKNLLLMIDLEEGRNRALGHDSAGAVRLSVTRHTNPQIT